MAKQIKVIWAILFAVSLQFGCVKAPVEFILNKEIELSEAEVNNLAEKIFDNLAELDFTHPIGSPATFINKDECSAAYRIWLRKRFDEGLLPQGIILPSTYGESSTNPLIHQCRALDFDEEYKAATARGAKNTTREGLLFEFSEFRDALVDHKCIETFLDPDQDKIEITGLSLVVRENSLSVAAPTYKLYTSEEYLSQQALEEENAEQTLIEDGTLMELGVTDVIPRHFSGKLPVKLNTNFEKFREAEVPAVALEGSIIALPSTFGSEPETITIANKTYYVVPRGKLRLTLEVYVDVLGNLVKDPLCIFREFKEQIRKDQAERKKNR